MELFYRNLYSYREVDQVNLDDILHNGNHKKINDNMKESIEGNITYDEVLSSLKKMSNNKSPGYGGFTVEFFKFFWNDLGHFLVRSINYAFHKRELTVNQKPGDITCNRGSYTRGHFI